MYWIAQRLLNFLWKKKNPQKVAEIWEWYWPLIQKESNFLSVVISFGVLKFAGDIVVKKSWISTIKNLILESHKLSQFKKQFYSCKK